ncbi:hypothetical protein PIB30_110463, partial [Stylosanthes scabra]|nr:hypothetical protein [Stylosanthes scabra]
LLLDPLILVGSILHLIVVYYLIRFGILAEIVGLLKIRINVHSFLIAIRKFNYSPSFNRCLTNLIQTRALEICLTD